MQENKPGKIHESVKQKKLFNATKTADNEELAMRVEVT